MKTVSIFRTTSEVASRVALRCGGIARTFSELEQRSNQLAHALIRRGLEPDDRLAIVCRNSVECVETVIAARKAGLRGTIVSPTIGPRDLEAALRRCDPRAIVTTQESAVEIAGRIASLDVRIFVGRAAGFENYETTLSGETHAPVVGRPAGISMPLTSGTTGVPKAVYRKHPYLPPYLRQLLAATAFNGATDLAMVPCGLQSSGVYNLGVGLPLQAGVGVIISDILLTLDVDAEEVLRTIERERVTHLYLPNFVMRRFFALPEATRCGYDLSSLKCVLHGGSAFPESLKAQLIDWLGPIVTEFYAGAEGGGTLITSAEWQRHRGSVGKPADGLVRIMTPDHRDTPAGSSGQIYLHAPRHQQFEYFNDPSATSAAYDGDYFTLGDLGYLDEEGYLHLTGRASDVIDLSGANVFPAEIDAVLLEHEGIVACAAVGLPDDEMGEVVGAVVVLRDGYAPSAAFTEELQAWCRTRLTFKSPRRLVFTDHIAGFSRGKVNRKALRDLFLEEKIETRRDGSVLQATAPAVGQQRESEIMDRLEPSGMTAGTVHSDGGVAAVRQPMPIAAVPDNMTVFAHLARQSPFRAAMRAMAERHKAHRFIEIDLPDGLVEALRNSVTDAMAIFGHSGWHRKDGGVSTYGGFSLAYNPDHQDNLDANSSSLGTPQNTADKFYYNQRTRNLPAKNSYFDTYGFRQRTPASRHSELGRFLDGLKRSLVRSRVGIIYGERVDPNDEKYLAEAGWHKDEPIYENLRVNIPLQTDPNFLFEIEGEEPRHLAVGKAYSWDTHIPHRVYCRGATRLERIHLVLGVSPWFDYHARDDAWQRNDFFGQVHPFDLLLSGQVHPDLHA